MTGLRRPLSIPSHVALGAKMVDFAGWEMPLMYPTGVVAEHLATRRRAGVCSTCPTWAASSSAARGTRLPSARPQQQRRRPRGRPGPVHLHPHRDRRGHRRRLPLPLRRRRVPAGGQRRQPREGLGAPAGAAGGVAVRPAPVGSPAAGAPPEPAAFPVTLEDHTAELAMLSLQGPLSREIVSQAAGRGRPPRAPAQRAVGRPDRPGPRPPRPHRLHGRAALLRALRPRRARPESLGSSGRKRSCSLWPRRAGHPAPGSRAASLRARAGDRPGGNREIPLLLLSPGSVRGELLAGQGRLRRPGGPASPAGGLPAHPGRRLLARRRPAPHHPAGGRHRARRGPGRRPGHQGRPARSAGSPAAPWSPTGR